MKHLDEAIVITLTCSYPENLLGMFELFFCKMPPLIVFLLFVGFIRIDTYYICSYVATGTHDTASIMHENVLSREVHFS